jgi:TetR/AcrR family transcriptional regulator, transcriptional repressor for nem operon
VARTPEFDRDQVLDAAMQAFWRKGYEATTLPDLLKATGLARQSLYNAFGDKRALFLATLRRYADRQTSQVAQKLRQGPVRAAIRGVFESVAGGANRDCGCLLINSAAELLPRDPEVGRVVASAMKRQERLLAEALRRGVREGELHLPPKRIEQIARFLMGALQSLPVMAKAMPGSQVLQDVAAVTLRVID